MTSSTTQQQSNVVPAPRITVDQVKDLMNKGEKIVLLDTRNPQAWGESNEKAQAALRATDANEIQSKLSKDETIVAYCT